MTPPALAQLRPPGEAEKRTTQCRSSASPHIPAVTSPWGALMGGVQRLAFNANQCEGVWPRMQRVICTPAPPNPYGNQSVGSPYGRRSAPGIPRHGGCTKNLYSSPRIGGCTVPLASSSSAPLPSSRGPCRQAGWIIAEGALALHAGPPHPNTPVGSPHGRRSAPGIPRQTNAGRAHPAPHTNSTPAPRIPTPQLGALMGGALRLVFHAKPMRGGHTRCAPYQPLPTSLR